MSKLEIIAITVSVNYSDILDIIIPENYKFFKKWYIITEETDSNTFAIINKYNYPNIELVFYNFKSNNKIFDKGGGIKYVQSKYIKNNDVVLLLDSDIILPNNFYEIINTVPINLNTLYGAKGRHDYHTIEHLSNNIIDSIDNTKHAFIIGYLQLYIHTSHTLYNNSESCAICDLEFNRYFAKKIYIDNLYVKHLGEAGINWNGRKTYPLT
jgi:hypothetical protein